MVRGVDTEEDAASGGGNEASVEGAEELEDELEEEEAGTEEAEADERKDSDVQIYARSIVCSRQSLHKTKKRKRPNTQTHKQYSLRAEILFKNPQTIHHSLT